MTDDELAEINGIKPKVFLLSGEEKEAWRNQSGHPVNARTCKHLKSLFGDKYEEARLKLKNPNGPPSKCAAKKPASIPKAKSTSKRKKADAEDEDEDVEGRRPVKKSRNTSSGDNDKQSTRKGRKPTPKNKEVDNDDEDEDDEKPAEKVRKPAPQVDKVQEDENENDGNDEGDDVSITDKVVPELLLASKWDVETGPDPTGWWILEKLDGVRTYYDGRDMISRLGNPFTPPKWFLEKLPKDVTLDGELFGGRGEFQSTVSIVKTVNSPHWKNITFQIFDIPSKGHLSFEERIDILKKLFGPDGNYASGLVKVVEHEKAKSRQHVLDKLKEIESLGGEGLMLRKPASEYEGRRSGSLLKIKVSILVSRLSLSTDHFKRQTFYDAEAVVTGHVPGKGRHQGFTGALKCRMRSGKTFSVGTGLSDKQRKNPPKIGAIIIYRFQELTKDGIPRFPSYVGEAIDKDEPKDAETPKRRLPGSKPHDN
ncbi:hypothetical protein C0995_005082 [Termitomyces sp. Mi166|nr:hypothetical protein C0995_005082 [Termitomyces sp. Mi166\